MKNEINMKKERLKAKRAKVPEAKFSVITVIAMSVLHSYVKTESEVIWLQLKHLREEFGS